jgi:hypothetical protein
MKNILFAVMCLSLSILAGCKKDDPAKTNVQAIANPTPTPIHIGKPTDGFGASNQPMIGLPYIFPGGIILNGTVKSNELGCSGMSFVDCKVNGTLTFYMSLRNTNSSATTVIFPAGLALPSTDTLLQCALLIQPDTILVPAASYICVALNMYCVNDKRTFSEDAVYAYPLITQNTDYNPMISLLAMKNTITANYYLNAVQQAVWDVANTGSLTPADIAAINVIP